MTTKYHLALSIAVLGVALSISGRGYAQVTGPDRATFIAASVKSCARTVKTNHPDLSAATIGTYCSCMAEGEADMTTQDDIAYINAHHEAPPDYKGRLTKLAASCNAKAGLTSKPANRTTEGATKFPGVTDREDIPLKKDGNTFLVPVSINSLPEIGFILDSGASNVVIPAEIAFTLWRTGTLKSTDFIGNKVYVLADGRKLPSPTFRIRELRVGQYVMRDVVGTLSPLGADPLLGGSFLSRFASWSIDNNRNVLVLRPRR